MAHEIIANSYTRPVAADYSASQYRFMLVNSSGQWERAGDGAYAEGVLQDDPDTAGKGGSCALTGSVTKAEAGGTVTAGGLVSSDSAGRVVDVASGDYVLGRAVTAATTAGERVTIIFQPSYGTY
jgi:hypothetical protein